MLQNNRASSTAHSHAASIPGVPKGVTVSRACSGMETFSSEGGAEIGRDAEICMLHSEAVESAVQGMNGETTIR